MQLLFRLPVFLLEMVLRRGLTALLELAELVRGGRSGADDVVVTTPAPAPRYAATPTAPSPPRATTPPPPPPPTAEEAIERRIAREAAGANGGPGPAGASPATPPAPVPEPEPAHVDREAEVVESFGPADDVVATIEVDVPWDGYDAMPAGAIVVRLRDADTATKGVVRLYEQQHKKRATVLRATA